MASARPRPTLRVATFWSYGLTLGKQAITAVLSFVLAAMLGPEAFGVIAMALVFITFIQMLQQQGLMPAIVARRELTALHQDTAFWMVLSAGSVLAVAGIAVAPFWAALNHLPELTGVIQVLALAIPLSSSVVVHEAILRRNMEFKRLAVRGWTSVLAGGAAGIFGAVIGWELWALVAQQLVTTIVEVIVLWGVSPWRPQLRWSRVAARELWSYSSRSASSSLGLFLGGRMDIIIGGAFFGPVVIGAYRMGQRVTELALDVSARGMQAVTLPALAEVQHNPEVFVSRLRRMLGHATSLSLPFLGVTAGLAQCVERFLGDEWRGVAIAVSMLAVVQAIRSVSLMLGPALQAAGRPGTLSLLMWAFTLLNVLALVLAATGSRAGGNLLLLCLAMIVATTLGAMLTVAVTARCFRIGPVALLAPCLPGLVAGVCGGAISYLVYRTLDPLPWAIAGGIGGLLGLLGAGLAVVALDATVRKQVTRRVPHRPSGRPATEAGRGVVDA